MLVFRQTLLGHLQQGAVSRLVRSCATPFGSSSPSSSCPLACATLSSILASSITPRHWRSDSGSNSSNSGHCDDVSTCHRPLTRAPACCSSQVHSAIHGSHRVASAESGPTPQAAGKLSRQKGGGAPRSRLFPRQSRGTSRYRMHRCNSSLCRCPATRSAAAYPSGRRLTSSSHQAPAPRGRTRMPRRNSRGGRGHARPGGLNTLVTLLPAVPRGPAGKVGPVAAMVAAGG